jgi:hypothetical protein
MMTMEWCAFSAARRRAKKKAAPSKELTRQKGHQLSPKKGEIRCLLLTETSYLIVKSSAYLSDLIRFPIA